MTPAPPLSAANDAKVHRYVGRLLKKLRAMEAERRSGEVVLTLGVQHGGVNRWTVETTEGGRADDE